jgi:hypothetical protein
MVTAAHVGSSVSCWQTGRRAAGKAQHRTSHTKQLKVWQPCSPANSRLTQKAKGAVLAELAKKCGKLHIWRAQAVVAEAACARVTEERRCIKMNKKKEGDIEAKNVCGDRE